MVDLKSLCKEFKLNTKCDILYADGTILMSTAFEKLQLSTEELKVEHQLLQMQCLHFIRQTYCSGRGRIRNCWRGMLLVNIVHRTERC